MRNPTRTADLSSAGRSVTTDLPATPTPRPPVTPPDRATAPKDAPTATYDPALRPTVPAPPPGVHAAGSPQSVVPGYELLGELGRGGMGVVWKARHRALDRVVALKMILAGPHAPPAVVSRFRDEARAVAQFQHPHIVQIFEVGEFAGMPYFSLEYVDGGTLSRKIARSPQAPRYAAGVVETLARAVQYAHDRNIVHRDLKPANVLLTADGTPKLSDFGLAKQVEGDSGLTVAGQVVGTPSFMAPEQAEGRPDVGKPADVWALGGVLYDLLTGRPPFAGSSALDTLEMVRTREPVSPGQLAAHVPRDIETICLKCLQKDPARRYASAGELADDLRRFLDGRPIVARPVPAYDRAWRWAKRNKAVAVLGSLAALLLLAVAVTGTTFAVVFNRQKEQERQAKEEERKAKEFAEERRKEAEAARELEEAANKARLEVYAPTLGMFREVALRLDERLRDKASLLPLRRELFEKLTAEYAKVRAATAKFPNPLEVRTDGVNATRLADVLLLSGETTAAGELFDKAAVLLEKAMRDNPDDPVHVRNLAAVINRRADVAARFGDGAKARALYAEALKLREEWSKRLAGDPPPVRAEARRAVAQSHFLVGKADLELGDPAAAAVSLAAADREYAALPPRHEEPKVRDERAGVWDRQGDAALALGKPDDALGYYRKSLAAREAAARESGGDAGYRAYAANARMTLGDFHLTAKGDPAAAWAEYATAADGYGRLLRDDPDSLPARRELSTARYKLGVTAGRLPALGGLVGPAVAAGQFAAANRARAELAEIDRRDAQAQVDWMLALGRCGKPEAARAVGWVVRRQVGGDRRLLFHLACGYAVAAGGAADPAEAAACRDRAVGVLGDLVARGWKDRFALEHDPDLDAVRGDPRFAELVAKVPQPKP